MVCKTKKRKYITLVENTSGDYGRRSNSGSTWFVRLSNNPDNLISLPRKKAQRLITDETKFRIEKFSAVFRFEVGQRLVKIKYKGFKNPEVANASTVQEYIDERRRRSIELLEK